MDNRICCFIDFLYYHNDELVYIRDLVFKNFPDYYNFFLDTICFVKQELNDKGIDFDINNLSMDISFGTIEGVNEFLSDVPSEVLDKSVCVVECYE